MVSEIPRMSILVHCPTDSVRIRLLSTKFIYFMRSNYAPYDDPENYRQCILYIRLLFYTCNYESDFCII